MTIGGALSDLNNLLNADDIPFYYKPSIKAVMDTIALEQEPTTKNDLVVDAVSRQAINGYIDYIQNHGMGKKKSFDYIKKFVANLPPATPQASTAKNDLGVDWDELKRKILMEVDGGTDDAWLAYGEVCNRISNSINEFVADMREVEE